MVQVLTRSANPAIREVARGLASARDEQIMQVVAMVDAMPNRGPADQLIAPLRARLARLRPPRPLRFARLLFLPLDPLIVPAARWRVEQPTIPRTVIPVLAAAIEATLDLTIPPGAHPGGTTETDPRNGNPGVDDPGRGNPRSTNMTGGSVAPGGPYRTVAALIEGCTTEDTAVVDAAGATLWARAGAWLLDAPVPQGWDTTGLSVQVYKPLTRRIGALLEQADRLRRMTADAAHGLVPPEANAVQALLTDAIAREPEVQPMLITLLMARIPECGPVLLRVATMLGNRGGMLLRHAGEAAADTLLDQLEAPGGAEAHLGGQNLAETGAAVRRLTALVGALDGEALSPDRRQRLKDVRARIRTGCELLFTERLTTDLLEPLRAHGPASGPEAGWDLETAARGLRALETEARRAGGEKTYDTLLGQAADAVREITAQGGLERVEGMRLMEIVAGPEAALAHFGEEA